MVTGLAVPTCLLCFEKRVPRVVAAGPVGARLADIGCPVVLGPFPAAWPGAQGCCTVFGGGGGAMVDRKDTVFWKASFQMFSPPDA